MAPTSGILYVTMQPKESLTPAQFHDWYNNEHGPTRLRLSFCKNGFRYRANDLSNGAGTPEKPEWMAIYDIEDMQELTRETYTRLRAAPVQSQRERDTMKQIKVDRRFYDFVDEVKADSFRKLEDVKNEGEGNVLVAVSLTLQPGKDKQDELAKWYKEEHIDMLSKVPGWRRTRRFVTSTLEGDKEKEWLALHEYAPENGLGGEEFKAAVSTPWNEKIQKEVVRGRKRRTYDLYYTFGPAPRDLSALEAEETFTAESTDGLTKTYPKTEGGRAVIESYVTTRDGVVLPYRLEGSRSPDAPLIVLSNSILTEWGIWDEFVDAMLSHPENKGYRVLRYHTRGRSSNAGEKKVTLDVLTEDIIELLDALRVKKAAAVVGVSLGGATAMNTGLKYQDRVAAFVACDTNSLAPPGNPKAWGERIEIAEKENAATQSGEKTVGQELAEATVRRWFVNESYDSGAQEAKIEKVKKMVESNSLEGFKKSVQALYEYDVREEMKGFQGKGAFVVGKGDGVLPKTMKDMAKSLGGGAQLKEIEGAGHLPMVEKPQEVAEFVVEFLA
ncbi:alpha/beta hydrolase-like protein [Delitschia confertaspora ATCC 74209]|uniref:Alpha/beta hydrolase-like protein n=1 Tax=Delitschia confertaspora ATCC 74209 TaxID=1513339 RepID=A0A9P4MU47_9PLEO|nr:alpha/beta hydrolase-like protein [Delitschia confertaspora ATCC 74209]